MNRREALKAGMALSVNGITTWRAFAVESPFKFIVFYNPRRVKSDFVQTFQADYPGSKLYPVEGNLDDAVRIFKE